MNKKVNVGRAAGLIMGGILIRIGLIFISLVMGICLLAASVLGLSAWLFILSEMLERAGKDAVGSMYNEYKSIKKQEDESAEN